MSASDKKEQETSTKKYYKFVNETMNHKGFQYKDGLNILTQEFNDDPYQSNCAGGFYFTTSKNLNDYSYLGRYLYEVAFPTTHKDFKMVKVIKHYGKVVNPITKEPIYIHPYSTDYRANMIILGKKYDTYDRDVCKQFGIRCDLSRAALSGDIKLVAKFEDDVKSFMASAKKYGKDPHEYSATELIFYHTFYYSCTHGSLVDYEKCFVEIVRNAYIDILEWLYNMGCVLARTQTYDVASNSIRIKTEKRTGVLEWCKSKGIASSAKNLM